MHRITLPSTLLCAALLPNVSLGQNEGSLIQVQEIRENVTVLLPNEGSGNTLIFRGPDGTLLVDTMADTTAIHLMAALDSLGVDDVRYVVNTHWHQNHLGANDRFSSSARIVGPESLRDRLQEEQRLEFLVQRSYPALPESYQPNLTFTDAVTLYFNGETIDVWHVRGHTDTDAIVHFRESNVAATGDLWIPGGAIAADLDTGGTLWGVEHALADLLDRLPDDATIVPGHGPIASTADLRRYHAGLRATLEHVRDAKRRGKELAQVQSEPLPAPVQQFLGRAAARMLEAAYRSAETR